MRKQFRAADLYQSAVDIERLPSIRGIMCYNMVEDGTRRPTDRPDSWTVAVLFDDGNRLEETVHNTTEIRQFVKSVNTYLTEMREVKDGTH